MVDQIEASRREWEWSARRVAIEPNTDCHQVSTRTAGRWLARLDQFHRRHLDADVEPPHQPGRITARIPGRLV